MLQVALQVTAESGDQLATVDDALHLLVREATVQDDAGDLHEESPDEEGVRVGYLCDEGGQEGREESAGQGGQLSLLSKEEGDDLEYL